MHKAHAAIVPPIKKYSNHLMKHGFSMLETIFVAALILALAVGGLLAYNKVTSTAKQASVETAASSVYTAALAADADGDSNTDLQKVQDDYNNSQNVIKVTITLAE